MGAPKIEADVCALDALAQALAPRVAKLLRRETEDDDGAEALAEILGDEWEVAS